MFRFGDGSGTRKKSSSSILNSSQHLMCPKCNIFMSTILRSLHRHSSSCTGAPAVKKQFGFFSNNQHISPSTDSSSKFNKSGNLSAISNSSNNDSVNNSSFLHEIANIVRVFQI